MFSFTSLVPVSSGLNMSQPAFYNLQQLNMTPFCVLGWSEGARTAIHVAGQGKDVVNSMVLLSAGTRVDLRGAGIFRGM